MKKPEKPSFTLLHLLEYGVVAAAFRLFRLLPVAVASALGSHLACNLGPLLPVNRIARRNLELAFPEMSAREKKRVLEGMWDNTGRTVAEFPHIAGAALWKRVRVEGEEHLHTVAAAQKPVVFISGHYGNWELNPRLGWEHGLPLTLIYRAANNPLVDQLIRETRGPIQPESYDKGRRGAAMAMQAMARGHHVGMLIDQKLNNGVAVPFFGHEAMTTPAAAEMARRYDAPIIMARVRREKGARFHITVLEPLRFAWSEDRDADTQRVMRHIHGVLEEWIRDDPRQWFWLHRRWPKELYGSK